MSVNACIASKESPASAMEGVFEDRNQAIIAPILDKAIVIPLKAPYFLWPKSAYFCRLRFPGKGEPRHKQKSGDRPQSVKI
jgi:hypothetical protein